MNKQKAETTQSYDIGYKAKMISGSIKDVDMESRMVSGYFSAFDFVDSDGDMLKKGCYSKTIEERGPRGKNRIMHLLQHDPAKPLGKPMELYEDDYGLKFTTAISETQYGTDTLKLYKDGVYTEHSVGINIIQSDYSDEDRANIVTEVKMWEGSTVTWGANEMAVGGMGKAKDFDALLERYDTLNKAWYKGDYTDDTFQIIKKQREHIESRIKQSLKNVKPSDDTSQDQADIKAIFEQFKLENKVKGIFNGY